MRRFGFGLAALAAALVLAGIAGAQPAPKPAGRPDLTIAGLDATPLANGRARISVRVVNKGAGPAGRSLAVLYVYPPGSTKTKASGQSTPALAPGGGATLVFTVAAPAGARLAAMADAGRDIREGDETNNRSGLALFGKPPPRPPLAPVAVDPGLASLAKGWSARRFDDGAPRPVAVARSPRGGLSRFVENELLLTTTDEAAAKALALRWNGRILRRIDRPRFPQRGSTYVIRVDVGQGPTALFGEAERGFAFSSPGSRNLLAIAMRERQAGLNVSLNRLDAATGGMITSTVEGGSNDALSLDYMRKGGPLDVNVADAWSALSLAGKLNPGSIDVAVLDTGFDTGRKDFAELDLPNGPGVNVGPPAQRPCGPTGKEAPCPWHGTHTAETLAGIANDGRGVAGPAGPVARPWLVDIGATHDDMLWAFHFAVAQPGMRIINMSFARRVERGNFFTGAWSSDLEDFEDDTLAARQAGLLLFAGASNDGEDVDALNDDGDEAFWIAPCENDGVICVAGWQDATAFPGSGGKIPDIQSNYGSGLGGTVRIWGPWCAMVGDDFDQQGPDVSQQVCGTSTATPFVAGVAALVWAANPTLSADQVWTILDTTAVQGGPLVRRVKAFDAVRAALLAGGVNTPPSVTITAPGAGSTLSQGGKTPLTASTWDVEDGFNCCTAAWRVDGVAVDAPHPFAGEPLGTKTIAVTITDKGGATATDSIQATLVNFPPTVKIVSAPAEPLKLVPGLPYAFAAEVKDDTSAVAVADASLCKSLKWTSNAPADPNPLAVGCQVVIVLPGLPGQRFITAAYTDAYGKTGFDQALVQTVKPPPGSLSVVIGWPPANNAFTAQEWIGIQLQLFDAAPAGGKTITYDWKLMDLETGVERTFKMQPDGLGGLRFRFADVFPENHESFGARDYRLTVVAKSTTGQVSDPYGVVYVQLAFIH